MHATHFFARLVVCICAGLKGLPTQRLLGLLSTKASAIAAVPAAP